MELVQVIVHVTGQCKFYIRPPTRLHSCASTARRILRLRPCRRPPFWHELLWAAASYDPWVWRDQKLLVRRWRLVSGWRPGGRSRGLAGLVGLRDLFAEAFIIWGTLGYNFSSILVPWDIVLVPSVFWILLGVIRGTFLYFVDP